MFHSSEQKTAADLTARPTAPADAPFIRTLIASGVKDQLLPNVPSIAQIERALQEEGRCSITFWSRGRRAGHVVLHNAVPDARIVDFSLIAATPRGRGYGSFMLAWTLHHVFEELHAHRLYLEVVAHNAVARRLYERHGFVAEGTMRDGFPAANGAYFDLCAYGLLEDEYGERMSALARR
jgi:diamine N-acetyltransferase